MEGSGIVVRKMLTGVMVFGVAACLSVSVAWASPKEGASHCPRYEVVTNCTNEEDSEIGLFTERKCPPLPPEPINWVPTQKNP